MNSLHVSQKNINNGVKGSASYCPIADSLKEQGYEHPSVWGGKVVYVERRPNGHSVRRRFGLPRSAMKFIRDFDLGKEVEPISFKPQSFA